MDLPSCPSCGQSVLDEDAVDCPFCGSSMSGKRGGGGAAPAKAAATAGASKAAGKKKAEKEATSAKSDDPFDVAAPITGKVIQLQPKPSKGRLHRIVCPMCETPGFHSKKAAGKDVKCANKECLVPLFSAPPLETEVSAAPEPIQKQGMGVVGYVMIAAVAAAALGGGAWYFTDDSPGPNSGEVVFRDTGTDGGPVLVPPPETPVKDPDVVAVVPAGPPAVELRKKALDWMYQLSLDAAQNRKPYCRRLAAEAWALQGPGSESQVQDHLAQLIKTGGSRMAYQKILPEVGLAWQKVVAGDSAGAQAIVNSFAAQVGQLPPQGMLALDTVTELAVLHVALGQDAEARKILESRRNTGPLGQLMESLARARFTGLAFDTAVSLRPPLGSADPQAVAVTVGLAARGLDAQATAWADTPECVAAWAETTILRAGSADPLPAIQTRGEAMAPVDRVRFLSRVGLALDAVGAEAQARAVLTAATEALTSLGTPKPLVRLDLQEQREYSLPDKSPETRAALAAMELGQLELAVNGPDAAWKSIELALAQTRGIAPSLTGARQPFVEIEQFTANGVMAQLRQKYGLQTADEVRSEYRLYLDRIQRQRRSAESRFALQARILTVACEWGLVEQAWKEMQSRATAQLPSDNEPWYESSVSAMVREWFRYSKQTDKQAEVERLAASLRPKQSGALWAPRYGTGLTAQQFVDAGNGARLAPMLNQFANQYPDEADRRWQQETLLRAVSHLAQAGKSQEALKFVEALTDLQIRMEAAELLGAEITAGGDREIVLRHATLKTMTPADRVALLRGFIERLPDDPPPAPAPAAGDNS